MSYRVFLQSSPSPGSAFYSGHVDVNAENEDDAAERAKDKLKRTSFPDYPRNTWKVLAVESR